MHASPRRNAGRTPLAGNGPSSVEGRRPDMRWMSRAAVMAVLGVLGFALAGAAFATEPHPWQLGMQEPGSVVKDSLHHFHDLLLWIITIITIFVLGLMIYTVIRFRASASPTPTRTSHNTLLEIAWTAI